jgi:hypothetical protein
MYCCRSHNIWTVNDLLIHLVNVYTILNRNFLALNGGATDADIISTA